MCTCSSPHLPRHVALEDVALSHALQQRVRDARGAADLERVQAAAARDEVDDALVGDGVGARQPQTLEVEQVLRTRAHAGVGDGATAHIQLLQPLHLLHKRRQRAAVDRLAVAQHDASNGRRELGHRAAGQ